MSFTKLFFFGWTPSAHQVSFLEDFPKFQLFQTYGQLCEIMKISYVSFWYRSYCKIVIC